MIEDYEGQDFSQEKLIDELLSHLPAPKKLWAEFTKSAAHVWLIKGDLLYTSPAAIEAYVKMAKEEGHRRIVLFVDYVQRIPVPPQHGRLLEEALQHWQVMGYKHPEYQITMSKGLEIPIPEDPIEVMYFFVVDEDLLETSNNPFELLDGFSINTFLLGGYHESGS